MVIRQNDAPRFEQGGTTARGYASPSRGSQELSVWEVRVAPGEQSPEHVLTREEVFLLMAGGAEAVLDGETLHARAGDCLVVPPGVPFVLRAGEAGVHAVCAMAAGGQAEIRPSGTLVTPPWAA